MRALETLRKARVERWKAERRDADYGQVRMTKAELLEAIKDYPDDAPVVVAIGQHLSLIEYACYSSTTAAAYSVGDDPVAIVLEL